MKKYINEILLKSRVGKEITIQCDSKEKRRMYITGFSILANGFGYKFEINDVTAKEIDGVKITCHDIVFKKIKNGNKEKVRQYCK